MTPGFGFPFGCVAAVAAVIVADLAGATGRPWYALVTLGAVVLAFACRIPLTAAGGVAVVAWALHTGFILGRFGELTFGAPARLAALVLAAALAIGALTRAASTLQVRKPASRSRQPTLQVRKPTLQARHPTLQVRKSSLGVRESSVRVREFAGRVLRVP
ncbi:MULTISPECIES: hypothetical protein [Amycolatopsis]|uniref:Uncharacterized protein n=1 Tax=Amycolatopsis bullii TaxID=941987 RepID=A0ABQ3KGE8_9PSEU|nr:hypothetical protein [Amycolatopsis bullii]GHG24052.1 hypothetical protein GCM10017567_48920 [Amycolatopsis bullii]